MVCRDSECVYTCLRKYLFKEAKELSHLRAPMAALIVIGKFFGLSFAF